MGEGIRGVLRTIDTIKNPVITAVVVFVLGAIDIAVTAAVILSGLGVEANPYYTWIQPTWLMFGAMLAYNLFLGVFIMGILHVGERYHLFIPAYVFGGMRVMVGIMPGVLILAGWA